MKVLVNGGGNIGTTLANLLIAHRRMLGIDEVVLRKLRDVAPFDVPDLAELERRGVRVVRASGGRDGDQLFRTVDYVFDCRKDGAAVRDRDRYLAYANLRGVSAQGSEAGFGVPFVGGVNAAAVAGARLVHIASCNTHAITSLMTALGGGPSLPELEDIDLVCVRRCEDVGGRDSLVGASVVSRHRDGAHGTHHAADAATVFATIAVTPSVTSSAVTTPSQLMHAVRFNARLRTPRSIAELVEDLAARPRLATTAKFDSNRVFELGRRYGFQGRLYAHAVVVASDLHASGAAIRGWAFVPQEGNTLLSTLEAFLLQTNHPEADAVVRELCDQLVARRL